MLDIHTERQHALNSYYLMIITYLLNHKPTTKLFLF